MRPVTVSVGPLAAVSATAIMTSTALVAGNIVLTGALVSGGVATMDKPRRVTITSAGNDSAVLFILRGTNWSGATISEALQGTNGGVAVSVLDYATLVTAQASGASGSTTTMGTSGTAGSPWVRLDDWCGPGIAIQVNTTNAITCTIQSTLDDPNDPTNAVSAPSMVWINCGDSNAVSAASSFQTNYAFNPKYLRVVLSNSNTTGAATMTVLQNGTPPL